jgi:hypothetical protein
MPEAESMCRTLLEFHIAAHDCAVASDISRCGLDTAPSQLT